jgi:hypothetical protein
VLFNNRCPARAGKAKLEPYACFFQYKGIENRNLIIQPQALRSISCKNVIPFFPSVHMDSGICPQQGVKEKLSNSCTGQFSNALLFLSAFFRLRLCLFSHFCILNKTMHRHSYLEFVNLEF